MEEENFEVSPELQAAMNALLQAAAHFALTANLHYKTLHPESAGAYAQLWGAGTAITDIRVQLSRDERRVGTGFTTVADGCWHPILTLDAIGAWQIPTAH